MSAPPRGGCKNKECEFYVAAEHKEYPCEVCNDAPVYKRKYTQYIKGHSHVRQDTCQGCHEQRWLDSAGLCSDCAPHPSKVVGWTFVCESCDRNTPNLCSNCSEPHDVILDDGRCVYCSYGSTWHEYPKDTLRASQCVSCTRHLVLNEQGICQYCYIEERLQKAQNQFVRGLHRCSRCDEYVSGSQSLCSKHTELLRKCADCGDAFTAYSKNQWQCQSCLPVCEGCSEKFVPSLRTDDLCASCTTLARKGECPRCGDPHEDTINGVCLSCQDEEYFEYSPNGEFTCWRCKEQKVSSPKEVCSKCLVTHFQCPSCLRQNLDYTEITCHECNH